MPTVPAMQTGDTITKEVLDEVLAMINERRTAVGLVARAWSDLYGGGNAEAPRGEDVRAQFISLKGPIEFLRDALEEVIPSYLNTAVHPVGDITGTTGSGQTVWTKTTCLQAAGVGGLDGFSVWNWTNIPPGGDPQDLADFSSNLYGTTLIPGPFFYKDWINEIILVARKLNFFKKTGVMIENSGKITAGIRESDPGCSIRVGCISGLHPSTPYSSLPFPNNGTQRAITDISVCDYDDGTIGISGIQVFSHANPSTLPAGGPGLVNQRGKFQVDLTSFPGASLRAFLNISDHVGSGFLFGQNPPVATPNSFQEWTGHGMVAGGVTTTVFLGNIDATFGSSNPCDPLGDPNANTGWSFGGFLLVLAPSWNYA